MRGLLKALVLPPGGNLVLLLAGLLLWRRAPRAGRFLVVSAVVALWLLATPWCAALLLAPLQRTAALDLASATGRAEAIVVLSADTVRLAPDFGGGPTLGGLALQRVRYAAALQRATRAPVLVSGGAAAGATVPHAALMRGVLEGEFGATVRWEEARSTNTAENATFSAEMLTDAGVRRVFLVTHAWHMPRAQRSFERAGLQVVPAPTAFRPLPASWRTGWLPSWVALRDSAWALHEWLGGLVYRFST